jgi:hypothetical protein
MNKSRQVRHGQPFSNLSARRTASLEPTGTSRLVPVICFFLYAAVSRMSRLHVPRMAPTMVAPLVVLQASLCLLRFLVGSCCCAVLSLPPCRFFVTNMSPIAFTADSSSMIAESLSVTVTSRFSISMVKGLRTRSRRALNSSKV